MGAIAATITQASATGSEGEPGDLWFQVYHLPTCMGGGDSMVRTDLAIEREVDDICGIWDLGTGTKRKEDQSSSNSGKKQKTSVSNRSWGQGRGHHGQGQGQSSRGGEHFRAPSQLEQGAFFHCHQLGHF